MKERYRVLGAMLAFRRFTVQDLARHAGIKPTTVRTILHREEALLKKVGHEATGRRGGQGIIRELRAGADQRIRRELEKLRADFPPPERAMPEREPPGLVAAEELLLRYQQSAPTAEDRQDLLAEARMAARGARRDLARHVESPTLRSRLEALEKLIEVSVNPAAETVEATHGEGIQYDASNPDEPASNKALVASASTVTPAPSAFGKVMAVIEDGAIEETVKGRYRELALNVPRRESATPTAFDSSVLLVAQESDPVARELANLVSRVLDDLHVRVYYVDVLNAPFLAMAEPLAEIGLFIIDSEKIALGDVLREVRSRCGFVPVPVVLDVNFDQRIHTIWKDRYTPFAGNIQYMQVKSVLLSERARRGKWWQNNPGIENPLETTVASGSTVTSSAARPSIKETTQADQRALGAR